MTRLRLKQLAQDSATTGQAIVWNGTTWVPAQAIQFWDDNITATGGETIVTLGQVPLTHSERVWKNTTPLFRGTDYTLSTVTLTLTTSLTAGDVIHTYYAYAATLTGAAAVFVPPITPGGASDPFGIEPFSITPFGV